MHDEPDVRLVDAQAERVRRHHRVELTGHEAVLHRLAVGRGHLPVIQPDGKVILEIGEQPLRLSDRRDVDDAGPRCAPEHPLDVLILHRLVHRAHDLEAQVRAREAGDRDVGIAHPELAHDVLPHLGGRRRREREHGWTPESLRDRAEHEVVGTEVVSPVAHAVGLVHDEQAHPAREQPLEELAILEALGREIEDLALSRSHEPVRLARLGGREVRVHGERVDPGGGQLVLLVLHERDEWAHDDGEPGKHQRGKLVDERLPAPRGHDDEGVAPVEERVDGFPLPGLKGSMAEALAQNRVRVALASPG